MLGLIFPWRCIACDRFVKNGGVACEICSASLIEIGSNACPRCADPRDAFDDSVCTSCRDWTEDVSRVLAMWRYEGALVDAVLRVKRRRQLWVLKRLADASRSRFEPGFSNYHGVTWIPASRRGLNERGYSVTALLARWWAGSRARSTMTLSGGAKQQKRLGRVARWENAPDFGVREAISGHWLIVDDVLTTGATTQAAAQALRKAGASSVEVAVLGRTPQPGAR